MRYFLYILLLLQAVTGISQNDYRYQIDLTKVNNDKITVRLSPPQVNQNEIEFCFPAMVPGTYEVYDFGRYISNFRATDKKGQPLTITSKDQNIYRISNAKELGEIVYDVDDTWDKKDEIENKGKIVFEPAGTCIDDGKLFCVNTHGFFGYFKGMTSNNFILEFNKPKNFYPATGLSDIRVTETKDIITVKDYHKLVDSPILYSIPDTTSIQVANTKVLIASYSPSKLIPSGFIARTIKQLLNAQKDYLGGELPVDKYAFLFCFTSRGTRSGSFGALEHSYSSFYVMPEMDSTYALQEIRDVAAHEFFHIVTPLTIHAKEIGEFDFNNPQMSEHLWLYEGMTEYAAHHAQAKAGMKDIDMLLRTMMMKYQNSLDNYNDTMSFTWMSKHVLEDKIHGQYSNVYEKGALIGMCLDILLRHYSNGSYGTQELMKDLGKKYGVDRSFNDADLFMDIEKLTYPEIGQFLRKHVGGHEPLPLSSVFDKVGLVYKKKSETYEFSLGNPDFNYNERTNRLIISGTASLDEFGKDLGFKEGDELSKLNGREITPENAESVFADYYNNIRENDKVEFEVLRPGKKSGSYKLKKLKAKAKKVKYTEFNTVAIKEQLSEKEKNTLRAWLGI